MKILVFSDSHGNNAVMRQVLDIHHHTADYALHAGDGAPSFLLMAHEYPDVTFRAVRGNCDVFSSAVSPDDLPTDLTLNVDGKRLLLLHGHTMGVKSTYLSLIPHARRNSIDIVIFGHTHERLEKYYPEENGLLAVRLFNPGAAREGCYGIIEVRGDNILMNATSIYNR